VLRFTVKFDQDLEDYVAYIFTQNSMNTKHFPTFKKQLLYIQPKLFTKILKVLYQCLSTALNFALIFTIIP
jgi:cell division protein FtsL